MMLLKRNQPHVGLLETSPTHLKMTKAIARYEMRGGILDLISNSVESEDGEEVFWNPFPLLCVPVSQCPSVLPFLLSRSPGQSASEAWGETNMKRDKNSSMVSKKNASNINSFCSHCWPLRQWSSVPGGGTSVPSGGFGPVFDDRAGLSQDEAAPQFTNAMTRPRPGNWPTLNIILGFRETRSELGNWGAATDQGSRRVKEKTKTEHFELIGNWKTLYFFDIKYMLMLLKCWRCANSNE